MTVHPIFAPLLAAASGETVAAARTVTIEVGCPHCFGSGKDEVERHGALVDIRCPVCHGVGRVTRKERTNGNQDHV